MLILNARHMMFWDYIMVSGAHSSTLPVQKFCQGLNRCERQPKTILLQPHLMIEVAFCNREECLSSKGRNCYMLGRMKEQVIMPHWMMLSMFVAKFQLHELPGM
uniref:Uncharacterized protein n=1 Tax=Opuntia streptacantha TaxID=393608 RepID=A0A7C9EFC3_OPUST